MVTFGQLVYTEAAKITLLPATATPVADVTVTLPTVTTSVSAVTGSSPAVTTSTHTETAILNKDIETTTTTTPAVGNEDNSSSLTPSLFVNISNGLPLSDPLVQSIYNLIQESQNPNHNKETILEKTVTESDQTELPRSSTVVPTTTTPTSSMPSSSQISTLLNLITPSSSSLPRTSSTETISTTFPLISTSASTKLTSTTSSTTTTLRRSTPTTSIPRSTTSSTTTTSRRSTPTTSIPRSTTESSTTLTSQETTSSYPTEASIIWALPPNAPLDTWTYFTQSQYSRKVNNKEKTTTDPPTKDKHTAKPKTYQIQNPYNWMPAYYFGLGPVQSDYVPARYGQPSSKVYDLRVKPKYSGLPPNIQHRRPTTEYGYGHTEEHDYRPINHDRPFSQDESDSGLYSGHRIHQHDQEQLGYGEGYGNGPYYPFLYKSEPRRHFGPFNMMRSPIGLGRGQISKYGPENIENLEEYEPANIHEDQYNLREHSGHGYGPYRYIYPGPGPLNEHHPTWTT